MVTVSWKRPLSGNSDIVKYVIMAFKSNNHNDGIMAEVVLVNDLDRNNNFYTYTFRGLTNNQRYTIGVAALNAIGMSKMSNSEISCHIK